MIAKRTVCASGRARQEPQRHGWIECLGLCEIFARGDDGITDFDIDEATARAWAQSIASLGREGFELVKLFTTSSDAGLVHHEIWVFRRTIS